MQPIKLFKNFQLLFRWNAVAWQVLNSSENQGVTNLPPTGWISPPIFRQIGKDISKLCLQLIFFFPCGFVFAMVTPLHFAHLVAIILGDFSEVSKIFTGYSWYVRSLPIVNSSKGICSYGTHKHFLSCQTWKTSCTSDNWGGSSRW
jgi:hypothetical protein